MDQESPATAPGAPVATAKWLTASVANDTATVLRQAFDEAEQRDPAHEHTWVALVDGNTHQIDRIAAEAKVRGVDFIHVLEYLWAAAWCFFAEGDRRSLGGREGPRSALRQRRQ